MQHGSPPHYLRASGLDSPLHTCLHEHKAHSLLLTLWAESTQQPPCPYRSTCIHPSVMDSLEVFAWQPELRLCFPAPGGSSWPLHLHWVTISPPTKGALALGNILLYLKRYWLELVLFPPQLIMRVFILLTRVWDSVSCWETQIYGCSACGEALGTVTAARGLQHQSKLSSPCACPLQYSMASRSLRGTGTDMTQDSQGSAHLWGKKCSARTQHDV